MNKSPNFFGNLLKSCEIYIYYVSFNFNNVLNILCVANGDFFTLEQLVKQYKCLTLPDNPFTSTQKLKVVGVSHEECVKRWAGEQNISVYKVCATQAEDQSGAPCLGDKGSPLMLEEFEEDMTTHYLVSIVPD